MRKLKPIITTREVLEDQLSMARGLPASDEKAGLLRMESGALKPTKETSTGAVYKIKLQAPAHLRAFYRLQDRDPKRGMDAGRLIFKKALGKTAKMLAMAAPPAVIRGKLPKGRSALSQFGSMSLKHNIVTMDENADVTYFGVKEYPPWVRPRVVRTLAAAAVG